MYTFALMFEKDFKTFSPLERDKAHSLLKTTFSQILTDVFAGEAGMAYRLQLELIASQAHQVLNHRLFFMTLASDRRIMGRQLTLHRIDFYIGGSVPEVGVYHEIDLKDYELWGAARHLEKDGSGPCHVLSLAPAVAQVISMDEFEPYLPEKLRRFKEALRGEPTSEEVTPMAEKKQPGAEPGLKGNQINLEG